jgi:hypothetical protein
MDERDAPRHRKYLGVMSAAVDDNAHYTNRCVPRIVQNTFAVAVFALYSQYTVLHVNIDRKLIVKKRRYNSYKVSTSTSIVS